MAGSGGARRFSALETLEGLADFGLQNRPVQFVRRRKCPDDDIRARVHRGEQTEARRLQATPHSVAPDGIPHVLGDDETEPRGLHLGVVTNVGHEMRTNNTHATANDHLVVAAARDAIGPREHGSA